MREIKFRALRLKSNYWEYGYVYTHGYGNTFILDKTDWKREPVRKETVGQFTGLKDKNGKEIYEGDIISCEHVDCSNDIGEIKRYIAQVEWKYSIWYVGFGNFHNWSLNQLDEYTAKRIEVVGNIYENKEL